MTSKLAGETIFQALQDVPYKAVVDGKQAQLAVTLTVDLKEESAYWLNNLRNFLLVVLQLTKKDEFDAN